MRQDINKHLFKLTREKDWTVELLAELEECEKKYVKTSVIIQGKVGEIFNIDENNLGVAVFLEGLILNSYINAVKEINCVEAKTRLLG